MDGKTMSFRRPAVVIAVGALSLLLACSGGDPPIDGDSGCLSCHTGIEQAHGPISANTCAVCHGGDGSSKTKEGAHVAVPEDWADIRGASLPPAPYGFIRDFAPNQLDALDPAYVRFINPTDIRVVSQTCGQCHSDKVATMPNSVMVTNSGHYFPTLYLAGIDQDPVARYGSYQADDPDCDPNLPGTVCSLTPLIPPPASEISDTIANGTLGEIEEVAYKHYLAKKCNTCHQAGYPTNNSPGLYRSTGCASCHFVYNEQGTYEGEDPMLARGTPVHPQRHQITRAIPTEQCATCHFQGGRIGLLFRGIREGGFGAANTPPNANGIPRTLYGHSPGYYIDDEDTTNEIDETPPDLHYEAGMHCGDCHVGSDVHGDGRIYSSSKGQLDLRCEDCHGGVRERAAPDQDGVFRTAKGRPLPQLTQREDGTIILTGIVDGAEHVVTQPADLLANGGGASAAMHEAMGEDGAGWSHTDSLTCDTCHTSYNQFCIGCHVSYDLRLSQVDYQTGVSTPGLTRGSRTGYSLDHVLLGTAVDGRVQSVHPSQQVQMAIIGDEDFGTQDGEVLLGQRVGDNIVGEFRHRDGLEANNGFVPFFQHTTTRAPRGCEVCHRTADTPEESARVRGVYGFGTGEFLLDAPDGSVIDGLQFLEADGTPRTTWVHPGTGPMAPEVIDRAFNVILP